jgi:hypothetical protein
VGLDVRPTLKIETRDPIAGPGLQDREQIASLCAAAAAMTAQRAKISAAVDDARQFACRRRASSQT